LSSDPDPAGSPSLAEFRGLPWLGVLCQKFFQSHLPVLERLLQLADEEKILRPLAENARSNFIADHILHDCSVHAISPHRGKFMPIIKGLERSFLLHVGEVVIPFETNDLRYPLRAPGKPGKNAERGDDFRSDSTCPLARCRLPSATSGAAGPDGFSGREA